MRTAENGLGTRPRKLFLHFFESPVSVEGDGRVELFRTERTTLDRHLPGLDKALADVPLLFTENESNAQRLWNAPSASAWLPVAASVRIRPR